MPQHHTLRGLEPPATSDEIEAAARQYVRKVSGVTRPTPATEAVFEQVAAVARATAEVLSELLLRRQPPKADLPLRRPEVRARLAGRRRSYPGMSGHRGRFSRP